MNPIYCKYSNDRAPEFQIKTTIQYKENGEKVVCKYPLSHKAEGHIEKLYLHYEQMEKLFSGTDFVPNRCERIEGGVAFEFLEGETLEQQLDKLYLAGNISELIAMIEKYRNALYSLCGEAVFSDTPEFEQIFGGGNLFEGSPAMAISNVDMVFGNILPGIKWTILDYEWIFEFPIPVEFVFYRALHYYLYGSTKRSGLAEADLMKRFSISPEREKIYAEMERRFQKYVAGTKTTMSDLKKVMLKKGINMYGKNVSSYEYAQIYLNTGTGYSEEKSVIKEYKSTAEQVNMEIELPGAVTAVRIDPAMRAGRVRNLRILGDGKELFPESANGVEMEDGSYIFGTNDPQIMVADMNGVHELSVSFSMEELSKEDAMQMAERWIQAEQERRRKGGWGRLLHKNGVR